MEEDQAQVQRFTWAASLLWVPRPKLVLVLTMLGGIFLNLWMLSQPSAEPSTEAFPAMKFELNADVLEGALTPIKDKTTAAVDGTWLAFFQALQNAEGALETTDESHSPELIADLEETVMVARRAHSQMPLGQAKDLTLTLDQRTNDLKTERRVLPAVSAEPVHVQAAASPLTFADRCPGVPVIFDAPFLNGHTGAADWFNTQIGIQSGLGDTKQEDVLLHECAHLYQYNLYKGDINALMNDMNAVYGGVRFEGLEANADCVALLWGARWTHYTDQCQGERAVRAQQVANAGLS